MHCPLFSCNAVRKNALQASTKKTNFHTSQTLFSKSIIFGPLRSQMLWLFVLLLVNMFYVQILARLIPVLSYIRAASVCIYVYIPGLIGWFGLRYYYYHSKHPWSPCHPDIHIFQSCAHSLGSALQSSALEARILGGVNVSATTCVR